MASSNSISERVFNALDNQLKSRNLSKRQLALGLGVAPSTVSRWWKRRDMPIYQFIVIMDILELELHLRSCNGSFIRDTAGVTD